MTGDQLPTAPVTISVNQQLNTDFALRAAGLGIWEYDSLTSQVHLDSRCLVIFGLTQTDNIPYHEFFQHIHADDIGRVHQAIQQIIRSASEEGFDQTYRIVRADNGQVRWLRSWGRVTFSSTGELLHFAGVSQDVTQQVQSEQSQNQVLALFEQSPVGIALLSGEGFTFQMANPFYGALVGRSPQQLIGKPLLQALPELTGQGFDLLLQNVLDTGTPFSAKEVRVDLVRNEKLETIYVDLTYQPWRDAADHITAILVVATDVTQQVRARQKVEDSETRLRGLIAAAPAGIGLFVGRDLIIELPNQTFIDIVGKGAGIEGLPLREAMPELLTEGQPFLKILDDVYTTGVPFISPASLVKIVQDGVLNDNYYNISYTPLYDATGSIYAILDIAIDVTAQVKAQQALAESEARFRTMSESSAMLIAVTDQTDKVVFYNKAWAALTGRSPDELLRAGWLDRVHPDDRQPYLDLYSAAFANQQSFRTEFRILNASANYCWLLIQGSARFDTVGTFLGYMTAGTDITNQRQSQLLLQEKEADLRNAIELAELGTWRIDATTNQISYSERLQSWLGINAALLAEGASPSIHPNDGERVRDAIARALEKGGAGHFDEEYTIIHAQTGEERLIRASGQTTFDSNGNALLLAGMAQDVTLERKTQLTLERLVQHRTEELAAVNKGYVQLNQELTEANHLLERSNDNLQQFAYIASHDLQEPLRKIQSFGDMLKTNHGTDLGDGISLLERMQVAAGRMSTLIRDLLAFSRISTKREVETPVPLNQVIDTVLYDLDLTISETAAQITAGSLPTVNGNKSQLEQLFQNLLSNALKFRQADVPPHIQVRCQPVTAAALPPAVRPTRQAAVYHQIDVIDNGIGFDQKYADRIFQVFQRLHGRQQYAGTGIGLAICEKVTSYHGGAITATSQLGQGAVFSVYLPAEL